MNLPGLAVSDRVREAIVGRQFALISCAYDQRALSKAVDARRDSVGELIESHAADVEASIKAFDEYFTMFGFTCPLPMQLRGVRTKGLPSISPAIDSLLLCEMTTGVLMGIQDLDCVEGSIVFDVAEQGERFPGFRGPISCKTGEPVLRDDIAIVASLFQGPDKRTSITKRTKHLLYYVFDAPDLAPASFRGAVETVQSLLDEAGIPFQTSEAVIPQ